MDTLKALGGVDFTKYALSPIIQYVQWSKIGHVKNAVNLSKMNELKTLGGVDFKKYALLPISIEQNLISALDENLINSKCCKFVKNIFVSIKLLYAHLQYVCNLTAKYQMNILKALGEVDFTKYALLPISEYVQCSKIG